MKRSQFLSLLTGAAIAPTLPALPPPQAVLAPATVSHLFDFYLELLSGEMLKGVADEHHMSGGSMTFKRKGEVVGWAMFRDLKSYGYTTNGLWFSVRYLRIPMPSPEWKPITSFIKFDSQN